MLYTVNNGNTGRPAGCQRDILHLVTTVATAAGLGRPIAFSNGNAGAFHTEFFSDLGQLDKLEWDVIKSDDWGGNIRRHSKASEFLVADSVDWSAVKVVGCHNEGTAARVRESLAAAAHVPRIIVRTDWYY